MDTDDLFEMTGNDRELEVLSGAALATVLDGTGDIAAWAALSTMTALFAANRTVTARLSCGISSRTASGSRSTPASIVASASSSQGMTGNPSVHPCA